jgi:hypothetical protein
MRKGLCVTGVILLVLLAIRMSWAGPAINGANAAGKDSDNQNNGSTGDDAQWTFLFYLAADNEQESYADATISQLLTGTALIANPPQVLVFLERLSVKSINLRTGLQDKQDFLPLQKKGRKHPLLITRFFLRSSGMAFSRLHLEAVKNNPVKKHFGFKSK